jgi:hypothetical protein
MRFLVVLLLTAAALAGASVRRASFSHEVEDRSCTVREPATAFRNTDRQIFFTLLARDIKGGDELKMEWLDPGGQAADTAAYPSLPASPALCFITQLPVAGFAAATQPGTWTMQVSVNGRVSGRYPFQITGPPGEAPVRIGSVVLRAVGGTLEMELDGTGFTAGSVVHIAEYRRNGGWQYIHSRLPSAATSTRLTTRVPALAPGEYVAIIRNPDDSLSGPARFLISTGGGYRLPILPGERWQITQGPYGGFSHWNASLHAYDIAPVEAKWVAAMRGGIAHAHDVGAVQDHRRRTFGNYITIDHGDSEYSHYAHLAAGTFLVKEGQRVEAGQALARVGNSGYTLGDGGGYHVHVHVTRSASASAQSIPFRFAEVADATPANLRGRFVSSSGGAVFASAVPQFGEGHRQVKGTVAIASTWAGGVTVPPGSKSLYVGLAWTGQDRDLDLRVVSPHGLSYGALGDARGYSGSAQNPEWFKQDHPEPGEWRIVAAGMKGDGEAIPFVVDFNVEKSSPVRRRRGR